MYQAFSWSVFQSLLATMDIRAHSISLAVMPQKSGKTGHQVSNAPGRPFLHSLLFPLAISGGKTQRFT